MAARGVCWDIDNNVPCPNGPACHGEDGTTNGAPDLMAALQASLIRAREAREESTDD